ncbi:MAG: RNA polymerase sigma-70 factor [Bacteroides acidifaciens]|uniref:RNA polymerase sigma-70 factor n=1 Tax=Bacteroides acidifaciens TaxID=85831 RepID=UPI0023C9B49E|nr:RNA polymerase sigma-70 factor [Bacteroides acidifaciens]MDE6822274.1 RNA polymerase sigma-70 factor [Bacteroides acidifaciens]MDE6985522.1 RNA polymerase sigma-70 factor [Bacteroides acidifaciens]
MDSKEISIEQVNKLDATAFRMLYKTYYKALVCYAMQITGELGVAEDIVQELFSTLWEKQMSFKSLVTFKAYLYNSVRNASIDYLKHKDVEFNYLQKILESHQAYRVGDEEEDDFFTEEIFRQLFMTIDSLPERCRQVFLLYMEGKKNEEIAAALYVSLETVKTQKKRAMSFLRKKLGAYHFALFLSILP